ncbi:MAG: cyclic nucleotide-binding domain-containing protein [Sandaracinaceae bacterium]|nr:cyclic nucleotide-binding domain-containing protein [Sandaracinaceae bacterium]
MARSLVNTTLRVPMPLGRLDQAADLGRVERMLALRAFPGWHDLRSDELATLAAIAHPRLAPAGTVLVAPGEEVDRLFLVVSGEVEAKLGSRVLGRYGPGDSVGGLVAFGGAADGYFATAVEDTTMLVLRTSELEEVFEDRFRVLSHVLRELARQIIRLRKRILPTAGFPPDAKTGDACPARSLDLVQRMFYLRKNLGMEGSSIDSVAVLAKTAEEIRLGPGEALWRTGDPPTSMVAILCGRVRCESAEGHVFELGAGDLAGSLDATAELPRWYDCHVVDGLVGLRMSHDITFDVWEDHPELPLRLLRAFSRSVLALLDRDAT